MEAGIKSVVLYWNRMDKPIDKQFNYDQNEGNIQS